MGRSRSALLLGLVLANAGVAMAGPADRTSVTDQFGCTIATTEVDQRSTTARLEAALQSGSPSFGVGLNGSALLVDPHNARTRHLQAYSALRALSAARGGAQGALGADDAGTKVIASNGAHDRGSRQPL